MRIRAREAVLATIVLVQLFFLLQFRQGAHMDLLVHETGHPVGRALAGAAPDCGGCPTAASVQPQCQRLLWFMAVDYISTDEGSYRLSNAKAALDSGLEHAPSLVPVLIYGGKPEDHIAQHFKQRGAVVLFHDVTFLPNHPEHLRKRRAQYYRLDAARLAKDLLTQVSLPNVSTSAFFYTDTDVLIEKDISSCSFHLPKILALSPESQKNHAYNSGVMYINIDGFLGIYDSLLAYARSVNWTFFGGTLQDQGLINEYFMRNHLSIELLGNEYNWKGYWGWNPNVAIVHFHGLKADLCLRTYVKSRQCEELYKKVCDAMGYKSVHYNFIDKSPDGDMWRFMYEQYLHHVNQTDDLSKSCTLTQPLPQHIALPGPNTLATLWTPGQAAGAAATTA